MWCTCYLKPIGIDVGIKGKSDSEGYKWHHNDNIELVFLFFYSY